MSWYGQARYDYRKRYFVEGNLAIESSSRFGKEAKDGFKLAGVRWGVFPGIQAVGCCPMKVGSMCRE